AKLPVTFYKSDSQLPAFDDYRMLGRKYRYLMDEPLYPFGHGLSYTKFTYGTPKYSDGKISVDVRNTGNYEGAEIVQVYIRRPSDTTGPHKSLRGYEKIHLQPGENRTVTIDFPEESFENWDEATQSIRVVPGEYEIMVGSSSHDENLKRIIVRI
ncbi:MAG: fibronectin type III-like domain-contianing protein, partial [Duncaniella sp.]|nr:fibronectin type III-like domain-contianing protein [Duncaniella sp.]